MNSISIAGFLVVIAGIIGWIMNIWKIIDCSGQLILATALDCK